MNVILEQEFHLAYQVVPAALALDGAMMKDAMQETFNLMLPLQETEKCNNEWLRNNAAQYGYVFTDGLIVPPLIVPTARFAP